MHQRGGQQGHITSYGTDIHKGAPEGDNRDTYPPMDGLRHTYKGAPEGDNRDTFPSMDTRGGTTGNTYPLGGHQSYYTHYTLGVHILI